MRPALRKSHFDAMLHHMGEEAVILCAAGPTYVLRAILDDADQEAAMGLGITVGSPYAETWYEWAPEVRDGDTLKADGESFTITNIKHDRAAGILEFGLRRVS